MSKTDYSGGCIVSKNILRGKGNLKWCFREYGHNRLDTGWRFLSDIDSEKFINNPHNLSICSVNTVIKIEPAVLSILSLPIGADVTLVTENENKYFVDTNGKKI